MNDTTVEHAKAVQELAKTTGQAIGTIERLGSFFARVMGEPIDAAVGMLADTLKFKRWERQLLLAEKVENIMKYRAGDGMPRDVPPKFLLPIFQYASVEDNDELHTMYAVLLAAAADPDFEQPRSAFADIVRQLEAVDVKILQAIYDLHELAIFRAAVDDSVPGTEELSLLPNLIPIDASAIEEKTNAGMSVYTVSFDNLRRLGLVDSFIEFGPLAGFEGEDIYGPGGAFVGRSDDPVVRDHGGYSTVCLTSFGLEFVKACTYGTQSG